MARLNTRTSATPLSRAGTVDSLYRDPTPASRLDGASAARQSSYSVLSPSASQNSDKENNEPSSRGVTPRPMGKAPAMSNKRLQRPATPDSGSSNKRRRTGDYTSTIEADSVSVFEDEDLDLKKNSEDEGDDVEQSQAPPTPDDDDDARFYDPDQNPEERRMVSALLRDHHREVLDNHDEIQRHGDGLMTHIRRANKNLGKIKQTGLAVQDSRLMVTMTDIAGKALKATLSGNNSGMGVDLDQFVSRAIYFMKEGEPAGSEGAGATQPRTHRRRTQPDDEDDEDGGDGLDWALLGRLACFPSNKRPPVPSFLLGPLSVQKRARNTTRRARARRQPLGPATRPEEVRQEDIKQSENSNLTHLVKAIRTRLSKHIEEGASRIEDELEGLEEPTEDDMTAAYSRHRIHVTPAQEAAVSLFDFAINPMSFGQTVENLFYISFLIREGNARVLVDDDQLPLLVPADPRSLSDQRQHNIEKHQAIFSLDWPTWKALIEAFNIVEPLIPHRATDEDHAANGWR